MKLEVRLFGYTITLSITRHRRTSPRKKEAARKATEARQRAVRERIQQAITEIKEEGGTITPSLVAKRAKVSYNTAKKYMKR